MKENRHTKTYIKMIEVKGAWVHSSKLIILTGVYSQQRNLARITAEVQREQADRTARETRKNPLQASMKRQVRVALPKWSRWRP